MSLATANGADVAPRSPYRRNCRPPGTRYIQIATTAREHAKLHRAWEQSGRGESFARFLLAPLLAFAGGIIAEAEPTPK